MRPSLSPSPSPASGPDRAGGQGEPGGPFGPPRPRLGWLAAAVWLFFLAQPLSAAWHHPNPVARYLGVAALVAFGASFVLVFVWSRHVRQAWEAPPTRPAWVWLGAMLALGLLSIPGAGADWLSTLVYIAASAVLLLPPRQSLVVVLVLVATPLVSPLFVPAWQRDADVAFAVVLAAFTSFGVLRLAERNRELLAAQQEIHRLAVAGERARAARDLHDILGHSLTVVAIKAELAGRLLEVDPGRAAGEIAEVEQLARQALADVRLTVGVYREVTLAGELASARSALQAAGMVADLPSSVGELPRDRSELFGWAVREGVTNVVRHSGARRCTVRVSADQVEILDDGKGPTGGTDESGTDAGRTGGGHGLLGLRERAEQLGGRVTVGRAESGRGFRLRVSLPAEAR
ncbi:histidine kinase [Micromonospora sp. NPDC049559]|uniref:sensor histidine kinase n=1 Tax=Micromonospora sp. NPDC049559 TaxID=3155923 RepID=UPI0034433F1D